MPSGIHQSATMTFGINENVLRKMTDVAEDRDVSLKTLTNQIFKRTVGWDIYEPSWA
jgi:hypothetical protein